MQDKATISRTEAPSRSTEELPYRVELWAVDGPETVERVLARALDLQLARAIFKAAQDEYPERRITLRKGTRIIADSSA
jgi:hypothetical protein